MSGEYVSPHLHWVTTLSRELPDWLVMNQSVPGDTTRMALERMPGDVQKYHPDVLVVQFGMNDCNHWETDEGLPRVSELAYEYNLREIARRGLRFGAESVMFLTSHPTLKGDEYEKQRSHYNRIVRAVDYADVIDVERQFGCPDELLEDQIHLSARGHEVYHHIVGPRVKEICGYSS